MFDLYHTQSTSLSMFDLDMSHLDGQDIDDLQTVELGQVAAHHVAQLRER